MKITRLGNPILREKCRELSRDEIKSDKIKKLIREMKNALATAGGVGISANQLGQNLRISVISIKPTEIHPHQITLERVLINPEIRETFGRKIGLWEGCLSGGGRDKLFGLVPRYKKVRVKFRDATGQIREEVLTGLAAHVIQHEIDHLNGIFFMDKVSRKSLMIQDEYRTRICGTKLGNYYEREENGRKI